jgi:hypothetical protein
LKGYVIKTIVMLCICTAFFAMPVFAQSEVKPFTLFQEEPIVPAGQTFAIPSAVMTHDGEFHMFHYSFSSWPANVDITHLSSPDGKNWTASSGDYILRDVDSEFDAVALLASSIVVEKDAHRSSIFIR